MATGGDRVRKVPPVLGLPAEETEARAQSSDTQPQGLESDVLTLAEELRQNAEDAMKIEMAPWTTEYKVDMDKQYTNLYIDKIENQPTGPEGKKLDDYKELFDNQDETRRGRGKRILVKGDPGIGKTTFSKKVVWDWAKHILKAFVVVFFVSMKFMRPGDAIENIVIQQTPTLQRLNVTPERLRNMLQVWGGRVLILLDGWDEYSESADDEFLQLLKGEKLLKCNVVVTSRPHSVSQVEEHFHVVLQIQGFTKENAAEFASQVLVDKSLVHEVLEIQCLNAGEYSSQGDSLFTCPMLLLFICILANNSDIDLSKKTVSSGEIYSRLVRSVYRKYAVSQGKEFHMGQLAMVLNPLGDLAFQILMEPRSRFKTVDDMKKVGEEAFKVGLIIGYEDYKLAADETADIVIDFPHRTIQEFLAAFWYMKNNDWRKMESLSRDREDFYPFFLFLRSLVLHFCLWFLTEDCFEQHFQFKEREMIAKTMKAMAVMKMDSLELETLVSKAFYHSLDFRQIHQTRDSLGIDFLQDVLSKCQKIRYVLLSCSDPIGWIMESLRPLLPQLSVIGLFPEPYKERYDYTKPFGHFCPEYITVVTDAVGLTHLHEILKHLRHLDKPVSLVWKHVKFDTQFLVSKFPTGIKLGKVHFEGDWSELILPEQILDSTFLTHLSFCRVKVGEKVLSTLHKTFKTQTLTHLQFTESDIKGKFAWLFHSNYPKITHLNLSQCFVNKDDIRALSRAKSSLKSLTLHCADELDSTYGAEKQSLSGSVFSNVHIKWQRDIDEALFSMFQAPWPSLTELRLRELNKEEYKAIVTVLNKGNCPQLRELDISMWKYVDDHKDVEIPLGRCKHGAKTFVVFLLVAELEYLKPVNIKTLTHLTLHRFICTLQHLYMVTQSKVLTQLHKLDISHSSGITGTLSILLCHSFPSLHSLVVSDCGLNSTDLSRLSQAKAKGRLPELKHLDISENEELAGKLECLFDGSAVWSHLESLFLQQENPQMAPNDGFLFVVNRIRRGDLASLTELHVDSVDASRLSEVKFDQLQTLQITTLIDCKQSVLYDIADAKHLGCLPLLSVVEYHSKQTSGHVEKFLTVVADFTSDLVRDSQTLSVTVLFHVQQAFHKHVAEKIVENNSRAKSDSYLRGPELREAIYDDFDFSRILSLVNEQLSVPLTESQATELIAAAQEFCKELLKLAITDYKSRQSKLGDRHRLLSKGVFVQVENDVILNYSNIWQPQR